MNRKTKWSAFMMACVLSAAALAGCTSSTAASNAAASSVKEEEKETKGTSSALVQVQSGYLLGTETNGTYIFKGVPYAKAERFMMPEDPDKWEGIRAAVNYGDGSLNTNEGISVTDYMTPSGTDNAFNENCQYLNVWTNSLDSSSEKPVIFFIHGGGFANGSSNEVAYYDGYNFAHDEDAVFVSINHRLNYLGYTDLSTYGDEYKYSGNVGTADIVKALEWVNKNITNFGGDPKNITIVGQSGGGRKVMTLLGTPSAKDYFQKAVCLSGGTAGIPQADAQASGKTLVENIKSQYGLATDEEALEKLKTMPYADLAAAAKDTGCGKGPVIDGDFYPAETIDKNGNVSDLAKDKPIMITTTFSELSSGAMANLTVAPAVSAISANMPADAYIPAMTPYMASEEDVDKALQEMFGDNTDAAVKAFAKAYPDHDKRDLLHLNVYNYLVGSLDMLSHLSDQSNQPVYRGMWAWKFPVFGGMTAWHTGGDLPFLFDNTDKIGYLIAGDEDTAKKIEDEASSALISFMKTGDPSTDSLKWPAYTNDEKAAMIFDTNTEVRNDFDTELLKYMPEPKGFAK